MGLGSDWQTPATVTRMNMRDKTTVHGLCRATFSTWANETGVARPDVIEACLAHQEGNLVRAAYNRAQFAMERRALLQAWADYLAIRPCHASRSLRALMDCAKNVLISTACFEAQGRVQVCVLAVRPVLPSLSNQPQQPIRGTAADYAGRMLT